MPKGQKRQKALEAKRQARANRFKAQGKGQSKYARKAKYLFVNSKWGFEIEGPKPW